MRVILTTLTDMRTKIFGILSFAWSMFVFSNSLKVGTASTQMSSPIVETVCGWFSELGIVLDVNTITVLVRKTAHFGEFFLFGLLLCLAFYYSVKGLLHNTWCIFFLSLSVGVIDELIQTFVEGRTGLVGDVAIDFAGCFTAFAVMAAVQLAKSKKDSRPRTFSYRY